MGKATPKVYDFIVVGGGKCDFVKISEHCLIGIVILGTAGALVAANLARCKQRPQVLLLDEGGENTRPDLRVASERFTNAAINREVRTSYVTIPQPYLDNRALDYWQGRGLGGGSMANFQAYIRGAASDYNEWADRVDDDFFAWKNAQERFKELENLHFDDDGDLKQYVRLKDGAHGFQGPVDLTLLPKKKWHVGMEKLMEAAIEFGWPVCRDQNSGNPIGIGCTTVAAYNGNRTTSGSAYLQRPPSNLDIWCNTEVISIDFERNQTEEVKAKGVRLANGQQVSARKEVILSAGSIGTPRLLLLSGVGPKRELRPLGIDCNVHIPQIGKNLTDHVWTTLRWSVTPELSDEVAFGSDKEGAAASRAQWLRSRTGHNAERYQTNLISFLKLDPARANFDELEKLPERAKAWIKKPDVPQIEIFNLSLMPEDWSSRVKGEFAGLTFMLMNPQSRGEIRLASKDTSTPPVIDPAFFSHPYDRQTMIDGLREGLIYMRSTSLAKHILEEVEVPKTDSDEDVLEFCRKSLNSVFHPCSTVRMGSKTDKDACLDTDFRLRGVQNLRVIDLSAIPLITR